jgi:predicted RNA-binding protein
MSEWLVALSGDNWCICASHGLLGLTKRQEPRLRLLNAGDRVWIYLSTQFVDRQLPRVYRIRAVARVTGPAERLERTPWHSRGQETFALAVPITVEREVDLPGKSLISSFSFVQRKESWGAHLLNAPIRLSEDDAVRLHRAAGEAGAATVRPASTVD